MEHILDIIVNENPDHEDVQYINNSLKEFNFQKSPSSQNPPYDTINLIINDANGNIIGGLLGKMSRFCYYIEILWVDDKYRGHGYGKKLLVKAEEIVKAKGCKLITLDTFSFQAPDFYQKNGFQVFGVLDGFPEGICRYYLKRNL